MLYRAFSGRVLPTGFLGFFYREIISLFWIIFSQGTVSEVTSFLKGRLFGVFLGALFPRWRFFQCGFVSDFSYFWRAVFSRVLSERAFTKMGLSQGSWTSPPNPSEKSPA